ncbi:SIS domain-containing protein [Rathayibacter soli]|uniref:SIS domain-containing protein n=1 Tax=Rathayibacter soli TaxID=3144168 RepID=UPI0027E47430|nr:SIS domain-containing protein [Glaciibacter superstes]
MADTPKAPGSFTSTEIASQPELWKRAQSDSPGEISGLPASGERVLVLGCGTSYFVAAAYAWLREQGGHGMTDAIIASELPAITREYDRVIAISRSGTTTEVIRALEALGGAIPVTAVLGAHGTPVERLADDVIDLGYADEKSVVQTRFPTTLLTLLRIHLGATNEQIGTVIEQVTEVLNADLELPAPRQLVVLGSGWAAPLAQEAALKCREAAGMWAEAYATGEYRHGPIGVAGPGTLVWALSPLTKPAARSIEEAGAELHQGFNDPQVELVALQRYALKWALGNGRNADAPTHLSRSVTVV